MPSPTQLFVAIVILAVVLLGVIALAVRGSRRRREGLVQRFGPEYERAVDEYGTEKRAERELLARERRVRRQHVHPLRERERAEFLTRWEQAQARFFDDPETSVRQMDSLIQTAMSAAGYELDDFEQRVADLSVEHAGVVQHYRAARALAAANLGRVNEPGRPDIDELRQAVVHYRALFMDLVATPEPAPRGFFRPAATRP
jgi:hypothetical protein